MSVDPSTGIAYLTIEEVVGSSVDEVQASGVLVAPDELLTAAHVVVADDGGLRTQGTVEPGYSKGASSLGTYSVANVHTMTTEQLEGIDQVGEDLALIHLSAPVTGGTVFAMSSDLPSTAVDVSGYPIGQKGALSETTETVTKLPGLNGSTGGIIADGTDAHGESGGPVWQDVGGLDVAYGVVSQGNSQSDDFTDLTAADISQIETWIASDHTSSLNSDASIRRLAATIAGDAASHPRMSTPMDDVASALRQTYRDGYTGDEISAATMDIVSVLQSTSSTPLRDAAYAAGLFVAEEGAVGKTGLFSAIKATFGNILGSAATRNAAIAGYDEGVSAFNA